MRLWNKNQEKSFFINSLDVAFPSQLFYKTDGGEYFAHWQRGCYGKRAALYSRDSLFSKFSKNWTYELFDKLIKNEELFLVCGAIIPDLGINSRCPADIVVSTVNKKVLMPHDVKAIFDIRMSIVWNWQYFDDSSDIFEAGDFRNHRGKPSFTSPKLMRDAIGRCMDIRFSNEDSSQIPIIVIGNAPLANAFHKKVDLLKRFGIVQGFWSLNPFPLNNGNTKKSSNCEGYIRVNNTLELKKRLNELFCKDLNFFSGMEDSKTLGKYVEIANGENNHENKGLKFLNLIR